MKPLLVTPGEPAGIGPDVLIQHLDENPNANLIAVADVELLNQRAEQLNAHVRFHKISTSELGKENSNLASVPVLHIPTRAPVIAGELNVENSAYVIECLDSAIQLCLESKAAGIVTGAIHKGIINDGGLAFSGHTEYLRDKSNIDEVVMMLATEGLRVALVTTHLPLKDVSAAITQPKIERVTRVLYGALQNHFGCESPNILVTGLNPHAGEDGHLGHEEIDTIIPALQALESEGIPTQGPFPADTLFQPHYLKDADAVLAMYHDQGLPVLKYKGFSNAVNITLGLPFIRTSVDHGTALDLAGTGRSDAGSMNVAIETALFMAQQQEKFHASRT